LTRVSQKAPGPADAVITPAARYRLRGGRLRAALKVAAVAVWTTLLALIWALGSLVTLLFPRARVRWRHRVVRSWARALASILHLRVTMTGAPPAAPFFLAGNHLTYLDILLLYTRVDGVFIAKQEMRHWPVLGPLAHLFGTIWVKREVRRDAVRVLDLIDEAISRGDGVILFAEGTTSAGNALLPMRPALFDWAAREQYPVHHVALSYRTDPGVPAHLVVGWWGAMPFGSHAWDVCRLHRLEGLLDFGRESILAPTRGELADRVERAIAARFVPLVPTERLRG
jgi:1-acyl-sn-glycerol-3-phosphate acyltransferase